MELDRRPPFGALLRQFRLAAGLSQEALAERAHVSAQGVSALERGARRTPQRETLLLLADALGLGPEDRGRLEASASRASRPRLSARDRETANDAIFHDLPAALTSFHGRDDDVEAVAEAVVRERLVTLTGAGGVGKTRLAVETARTLGEHFPDGIWFVELTAIDDPELVVHRVAEVVRAPLALPSLVDAVVAALRPRRALLIFDTCEHVLAAVAALAHAIVQRTDHIHVLATSRQALGTSGEVVRLVRSLSLPQPDAIGSAADAQRASSVALFVARARAASDSFVLTDANARSVADICRRVDGIPLAIELVAPRVAVLAPHHVADLLRERFRLLTAPSTSGLPRQQTMRAVLDWSFDLLDARERTLFRRLGAFNDGCTFELCQTVCTDEQLSAWDVLDALTALVAKSLVVVDGEGDARRFRLLDSTRAYAFEHLERSGEFGAVMERTAAALAAHVHRLRDLWDDMENVAWQRAIGAERETIRAVLAWSFAGERAHREAVAMLVDIADPGLVFESQEIARWYEQAATLIDGIDDPVLAAMFARCSAATASLRRASPEASCALSERAVCLARLAKNPALLGEALRAHGIALRYASRLDAANDAFTEGWALTESHGTLAAKAALLGDWAWCELRQGQVDASRDRLRQCLRISRSNSIVQANTLAALGEVAFSSGDARLARAFAEQARTAFRTLNLRLYLGVACCNAAAYAMAANDLDHAQLAISEGIAILRETGLPYYVAVALEHYAVYMTLMGDDDDIAFAILGYTQRTIADAGRTRESTEQQGYDRALSILEERHGPGLALRLAEGAMLDESRSLQYVEAKLAYTAHYEACSP